MDLRGVLLRIQNMFTHAAQYLGTWCPTCLHQCQSAALLATFCQLCLGIWTSGQWLKQQVYNETQTQTGANAPTTIENCQGSDAHAGGPQIISSIRHLREKLTLLKHV
eukprot:440638-Amphidinium_carterae.1